MQRSCRVEDQGVHRSVAIVSEGLGQLPIAGHPAPQRIHGDQVAGVVEGKDLGKMSRLQRTHGKGFRGPAVQGRGGVEDGAVHHVLAGAAYDQLQPTLRAVQPVLQDTGQGRVCGKEVGQFVEYERSLPVGPPGLHGKPCQERAPVRVFDVGKAGEPFGDRSGQVAPLHRRRGLVSHGVEAVVTPGPLDEQA